MDTGACLPGEPAATYAGQTLTTVGFGLLLAYRYPQKNPLKLSVGSAVVSRDIPRYGFPVHCKLYSTNTNTLF
jgi:hypothetical protein